MAKLQKTKKQQLSKKKVKKTSSKVKKVNSVTVKKTVKVSGNNKLFSLEIALLDKLQNELFEAIASKPSSMDYEEIRLYIDNVYMVLNKCTSIAKDIKNSLIKKDFDNLITETYNSPA